MFRIARTLKAVTVNDHTEKVLSPQNDSQGRSLSLSLSLSPSPIFFPSLSSFPQLFLSLSPLRFHVLHLHVKLDWLQENWTVSHRNIRCLLPRILASPSPPSWYTQSVQTWPWRVVHAHIPRCRVSRHASACAPMVFAYFKLFRGRC